MSAIKIQLPRSLEKQLRELAEQEEIPVEQFITTAVAEKMAALLTEDCLKRRASRGSQEKFDRVLAKVLDVEPDAEDRESGA